MQTRPLACLVALVAMVALLLAAACSGGHGSTPTSPSLPNSFALTATISDSNGVPHLVEAQAVIDGVVLADSCPATFLAPVYDSNGNLIGFNCTAPAISVYTFITGGGISPGSHTLQFYVVSEQGSVNSYTVSPCKIQILDSTGTTVEKTITFPPQTAALAAGAAITYTFSF